jgi:hypothetical protein
LRLYDTESFFCDTQLKAFIPGYLSKGTLGNLGMRRAAADRLIATLSGVVPEWSEMISKVARRAAHGSGNRKTRTDGCDAHKEHR